jgi:hypothetical protein
VEKEILLSEIQMLKDKARCRRIVFVFGEVDNFVLFCHQAKTASELTFLKDAEKVASLWSLCMFGVS